ncbi:uncharacterized protein K441DRAFT_725844 [Cenococcum geophilum 1.58]|uniref:uncharacterized protein n=1 Tax=Cenococcum geophilum 1.58 TaxID=794803 RepID=UPI00358EEEB9|nr:hypothetical protein K441DRAFT_725844 [Cenococcum geophilum 1.58]
MWNVATRQVEQTLKGYSVSSVVVLARWEQAGVGIIQEDCAGVECHHKTSGADARGPFGLGQQRSVLARWEHTSFILLCRYIDMLGDSE